MEPPAESADEAANELQRPESADEATGDEPPAEPHIEILRLEEAVDSFGSSVVHARLDVAWNITGADAVRVRVKVADTDRWTIVSADSSGEALLKSDLGIPTILEVSAINEHGDAIFQHLWNDAP